MKKFRKLIPALALLLVSAVLMSTASYAWFSMNNKVTVVGMEVKTKVSSNLLIAPDTLESTAKLDDSLFTTSLTQQVKGVLEPASTANAKDFFYTIDAKANGAYSKVGSEAFIPYDSSALPIGTNSSAYADRFSEVYDVTTSSANNLAGTTRAVPYVDYVFQLKATNANSDKQYIVVETLNLKYNGSVPDSKAHRVAFFVEDISSGTATGGPAGSSATYTVASSANFDDHGNSSGTQSVVSGPSSYSSASYVGSEQALTEVNGNDTKYFKVVVRMWLEGQDTTCNNETFMELTDKWELGIKLALVDTVNESTTRTYINEIDSSGNLVD